MKDMKKEKISDALSGLQSEYIKEAAEYKSQKKQNSLWIKWMPAAAALVITVSAAVILQGSHNKNSLAQPEAYTSGLSAASSENAPASTAVSIREEPEVQPTVKDSEAPNKPTVIQPAAPTGGTTEAELATVKPWDDRSLAERYLELNLNSISYSGRAVSADISQIGRFIAKSTVAGQDYESLQMHYVNCEVNAINKISADCAVAVRFEGGSDYYVFVNSWYRPQTLKDLIDDLNLRENMSFGSVWYRSHDENGNYQQEYTGIDSSVIWDMLLSDTSVKNVENYDSHFFLSTLGVNVNIPLLGYENISLGITDDGYLITNILDTGKAFFIGRDKTEKFKNYIISR